NSGKSHPVADAQARECRNETNKGASKDVKTTARRHDRRDRRGRETAIAMTITTIAAPAAATAEAAADLPPWTTTNSGKSHPVADAQAPGCRNATNKGGSKDVKTIARRRGPRDRRGRETAIATTMTTIAAPAAATAEAAADLPPWTTTNSGKSHPVADA